MHDSVIKDNTGPFAFASKSMRRADERSSDHSSSCTQPQSAFFGVRRPVHVSALDATIESHFTCRASQVRRLVANGTYASRSSHNNFLHRRRQLRQHRSWVGRGEHFLAFFIQKKNDGLSCCLRRQDNSQDAPSDCAEGASQYTESRQSLLRHAFGVWLKHDDMESSFA